jgi:hypothetical protein
MNRESIVRKWLWNGKMDAIVWAGIFIWSGLMLYIGSSGVANDYSWYNGWAIWFLGVGSIVLLGTLVSLAAVGDGRPVGCGLVFGIIMLGIGSSAYYSGIYVWPLVLVGIGGVILVSVFNKNDNVVNSEEGS